jgi:toxin-antitoxin system PIN domain toxin
MIVPDINLLVYAHNARTPRHAAAKAWWEGLLNGTVPVGIPWITISGFIRLTTHPSVLAEPMEVGRSVAYVRAWLAQPPVRILQPGPKFERLFLGYLLETGTAGNLTTDAQLAALAVEHQAELHSNDSDFTRFPGLRWSNPLA